MKSHTIFASNRANLNYVDMFIQLLIFSVCEFAFDQVHLASSHQRTLLHDLPAVDPDVYKRAMRVDSTDTARRSNVVHSVSTLSAIDQSAFQRFRAVDSDLGILCGKCT